MGLWTLLGNYMLDDCKGMAEQPNTVQNPHLFSELK
jgi:hypothetical protein